MPWLSLHGRGLVQHFARWPSTFMSVASTFNGSITLWLLADLLGTALRASAARLLTTRWRVWCPGRATACAPCWWSLGALQAVTERGVSGDASTSFEYYCHLNDSADISLWVVPLGLFRCAWDECSAAALLPSNGVPCLDGCLRHQLLEALYRQASGILCSNCGTHYQAASGQQLGCRMLGMYPAVGPG